MITGNEVQNDSSSLGQTGKKCHQKMDEIHEKHIWYDNACVHQTHAVPHCSTAGNTFTDTTQNRPHLIVLSLHQQREAGMEREKKTATLLAYQISPGFSPAAGQLSGRTRPRSTKPPRYSSVGDLNSLLFVTRIGFSVKCQRALFSVMCRLRHVWFRHQGKNMSSGKHIAVTACILAKAFWKSSHGCITCTSCKPQMKHQAIRRTLLVFGVNCEILNSSSELQVADAFRLVRSYERERLSSPPPTINTLTFCSLCSDNGGVLSGKCP